jgi:hypothetical protein
MKLDTGNGGEFVWSSFSLSPTEEEDTATETSCDVRARTNRIEVLREAGTVSFLCLGKKTELRNSKDAEMFLRLSNSVINFAF